jgi:cutinase
VDSIPSGYQLPPGITGPMAPEVAKHVAAVALFGKPSSGFMQMLQNGAPPITVGHLYSGKTTDLCIPEDTVCSPTGNDFGAHNLYAENGMTVQAADFAAHRIMSGGSAA